MTMSSSYYDAEAVTLRLAIPECEELTPLCEQLERCGLVIPPLERPGLHALNDPLSLGINLEVFKLASSDVGTYVERGISHLGVASTELLRETEARLWRPFTFSYGTYPLVLVAPRGTNLDVLSMRPLIRIATSLPRLTRELFSARGVNIDVVNVEDSATACLLGLADAYVERMSDPEALVRQDFRVLEVLGYARLKLVVNRASYTMRRSAIDRFIALLDAEQPPAPPPLDVPFDGDDEA